MNSSCTVTNNYYITFSMYSDSQTDLVVFSHLVVGRVAQLFHGTCYLNAPYIMFPMGQESDSI